jgi:hypothetical protein
MVCPNVHRVDADMLPFKLRLNNPESHAKSFGPGGAAALAGAAAAFFA